MCQVMAVSTTQRTPPPIYFRTLDGQPWERADREAAEAWQRARMFHAMTRAVSEKGYAKVTVADVVAIAGMSRRTFYEHFKDVEDCFVAAYDAATRALLAEVESAVRSNPFEDWHDRFEVSIAAYLRGLASDPYMARACLGTSSVRPASGRDAPPRLCPIRGPDARPAPPAP